MQSTFLPEYMMNIEVSTVLYQTKLHQVMKKHTLFFSILFFCLNLFCTAQSLPKLTPKDYGFSENLKSVSSIKYYVEGDEPRKQSEDYYFFGPNRKIMVFTESNLIDEAPKESTIFKYDRDEVTSETHKSPNPNEDYETTFQYDASKSLVSSQYKSKYFNFEKKFFHTGNNLSSVISTNEMGRSEEQYFYNNSGELYAIHNTETVGNGKETITILFQNNREIARYSTSKSRSFGLNYITDSKEFYYLTKDESIKKELETLELFLNQNKSKDLDIAQKIRMIVKKAKDPELVSAKYFIKNKKGDLLASAELEAPFEEIKMVRFYRINYTSGSIDGTTEFQKPLYQELQKMLENEKKVGLLR